MTISIKETDILMINHFGDKNENLRHPLLVVEVTDDCFVALQVTAPKFNQQDEIILNSDFITAIYRNKKYIVCDINDGFKWVTWVLLDRVYQVEFGENKYRIRKVGEMTNKVKFKEIVKRYKLENGIPLSILDFLNTLF